MDKGNSRKEVKVHTYNLKAVKYSEQQVVTKKSIKMRQEEK
jgi:hypothetical protein